MACRSPAPRWTVADLDPRSCETGSSITSLPSIQSHPRPRVVSENWKSPVAGAVSVPVQRAENFESVYWSSDCGTDEALTLW